MKSLHSLSSAHQALDFPEFEGIAKPYVIASQPRCGSHFLAQLLYQTGRAGCPLEYFHDRHWHEWQQRCRVDNARQVFKIMRRRRTSPNAVFGVKTHWNQFVKCMGFGLEEQLRSAKIIYLTREDLLAQAISHVIALQTGQWTSTVRKKNMPAPSYSQARIESSIDMVLAQRRAWEWFFCTAGLQPLRLTYEALLLDPQGWTLRILDFLGAGNDAALPTLPADPIAIQRTALNEAWRSRFLAAAAMRHDDRHKWQHLARGPAPATPLPQTAVDE